MDGLGNLSLPAAALALSAFVFQTFATKEDVKLVYDRVVQIEAKLDKLSEEAKSRHGSTESETTSSQSQKPGRYTLRKSVQTVRKD